MALTAQDFQLTESQIREVNAFIEKAAVDFFASDGDLDPIEIGGVTISFDFDPAFGRQVTVQFAGTSLELE